MKSPDFLKVFRNHESIQKEAYAHELTRIIRSRVQDLNSNLGPIIFDPNMNTVQGDMYRVTLSPQVVEDLVPGSFERSGTVDGWAEDDKVDGKVTCGLAKERFVVRFVLDKNGNVTARKEIGAANFISYIAGYKTDIVPNPKTIDGKIMTLQFGIKLLDTLAPRNSV